MTSLDILSLAESFFVAIGIPDNNLVLVLNCTYDFNNCFIFFNSVRNYCTR